MYIYIYIHMHINTYMRLLLIRVDHCGWESRECRRATQAHAEILVKVRIGTKKRSCWKHLEKLSSETPQHFQLKRAKKHELA